MWKDDVRILVRSIINDMIEPYTYEDSRINTLIIHATKIMCNDVPMDYDVNLSNNTVTPDPSSDSSFIILSAYRTACMFAAAEVKTYNLGSMVVTDGPSTINLTQAAANAQKWYEDLCSQYEDKKLQYNIESGLGKVVSGPIVYENLPIKWGNINGCY